VLMVDGNGGSEAVAARRDGRRGKEAPAQGPGVGRLGCSAGAGTQRRTLGCSAGAWAGRHLYNIHKQLRNIFKQFITSVRNFNFFGNYTAARGKLQLGLGN
jgi:hypothetical protein